MSIATELQNLNDNILDAYDAVQNKGGTIPANKNTTNLGSAIASIPSGSSVNTITIEIGANSVTQAAQLYDYFLPYFQGAKALLGIEMVENTYTVNNQFIRYRYGESLLYRQDSYRWRNGSANAFNWAAGNYDTTLVAGTHYTITWVS